MGNAGAIACFIALIAVIYGARLMYTRWLEEGMSPRTFVTGAPPDVLRSLFVKHVAGYGWNVIDDGNPMVAQSPIMTGIRQQIALDTKTVDGGTQVEIKPLRWATRHGMPTKAHTMRTRMQGFVHAVQAVDGSINVQTRPLRGK